MIWRPVVKNNISVKQVLIPGLLVAFALCSAAAAADSKYAPRRLMSEKNGADYIVVAPDAFMDALAPLMDKRAADGLRVAAVSMSSVKKEFFRHAGGAENIADFIKYAWRHWKAPAPKYLLLVGDTSGKPGHADPQYELPTFYVYTQSATATASDNPYADVDGDELPEISVGRIPADTPEELKSVIAKILDYENGPETGTWRRRVSVFASEGHFGAAIDSMLEEMFKKLVSNNVSPNFDLSMTYANPNIPYFYIPDHFGDKVIDRFNEGSLFMVYIGHGSDDSFDNVWWGKKRYPIMTLKDVPRVDSGRMRQLLFIIACDTGKFTITGDSIAEALLKSPTGPVGVFAASEESQPYSNAILAKDIAHFFLGGRPETAGQGILDVKRALIQRNDEDRKLIDGKAVLMMSKKDMDIQNRDHLYLYNFLGDPATRIPYPADGDAITAPDQAAAGGDIPVVVKSPGGAPGRVLVTLECPPTEIIYEITDTSKLEGDAMNQAIKRNYENANNKVAASMQAPVSADGTAKLSFKVPAWVPPGVYYIKAYVLGGAQDSTGYERIRIVAGDGK